MKNLREWEKHLASLVKNVELLGDIELTLEEFKELTQELKEFTKEYSYISLKNYAPLSLAVFLVRIGIEEYSEGNYWSAVQQTLGLPIDDPRWQRTFGDSFLNTLDEFAFPKFDKAGLKYVTPILAHGRVPNNYLENYFDVIFGFFTEKLKDDLSKDYIRNTVELWREDHSGRIGLQTKLDKEKAELKKVNDELNKHSNIIEYLPLYEKAKEISNRIIEADELAYLLALPEDFCKNAEIELEKLNQELHGKQNLLKAIVDFKKERSEKFAHLTAKQHVLDEIIDSIEMFTEKFEKPISENIGREILALPLDELEAAYQNYTSSSQRNIFYNIKIFFLEIIQRLFGKKKQEEKYAAEIKELVADIPFKESILLNIDEVYRITKDLRTLFTEYFTYKREIESLEIALEQIKSGFLETAAGKVPSIILDDSDEITVQLEKDIKRLHNKIIDLEKEINDYKTKVVALGKGNFEKGKEILAEQRKYRKDYLEISEQIGTDRSFEIFERNTDITTLKTHIEELKKKRNALIKLAEVTEKKLQSYPEPPLYNLNESAKKFIYFGEDISIDFIYETANMLKSFLYGEDLTQVNLPVRIQESAKEWIMKHGEELEKIKHIESTEPEHLFRTPSIYYDQEIREIRVNLPEQRFSKALVSEDRVSIKIFKDDYRALIDGVTVRLYSMDTFFLTEEKNIILTEPAKTLTIELRSGEKIIQTWSIPLMFDDNPFIIFDQKGKKIDTDKVFANERAILILDNKFKIGPSEIIEGEENLYDGWFDYKSCYLNLTDASQIVLLKDDDVYTLFRKPDRLKPTLIGQNMLRNITIKNSPVYLDSPPEIIFSEAAMQLRLWQLILKVDEIEKYYLLDDLTGLKEVKDDIIRLPLSKLTNNKFGTYQLFLEKRGVGGYKCEFEFSVLPNTSFEFDKEFYEPNYSNKRCSLQIKSSYSILFAPLSSSYIVEAKTNKECIVKLTPDRDTIAGDLSYQIRGSNLTFPIRISIPAIGYMYDDSESWNYEIQELWHEDIENLRVFIPIDNISKVVLYINDREQESIASIANKIATFDLAIFKDTFRENKKSVQELFIEFPERRDLTAILLNRIRTRWEVSDVSIKQDVVEKKRILIISWEEKGKAANRAIVFWEISSGAKLFEFKLEDDTHEFVIEKPLDDFPDGAYRIQFLEIDPWETAVSIMPESDEINTSDVLIGEITVPIDKIIQHGIRVAFFSDDQNGNLYTVYPANAPLINDIKQIKGEDIEAEYQGMFYQVNEDGELLPMPTNPVRFMINEDMSLAYLIDRDRDGPMYCPKCREIFWEIREKHKRHHIEPRKIFFYLNR
ncbi:MAG: hypothetical protein WBJ82_09345 [Tepidanaerobacteraceae bacterium]|jgi:hypothetical protein